MAVRLRSNNLYINGRIVLFDDGEQVLIREPLKKSSFNNISYYSVKEDEELTAIAYKCYVGKVKDPSKLWWLIADINDIFKPFDLSTFYGKDLLIPDVTELKTAIEK